MTTELWAIVFIGSAWLVSLWITTGLALNCLKKVDRCEDRLMAMSAQFPHQAYLELQQAQMSAWQQPQYPAAPVVQEDDRDPGGPWVQEAS